MTDPDARALLERVPPFNQLGADAFTRAAASLTPSLYAPGETILRRWTTPPSLFIVAEGIVEETDQTGPVAVYSPGESFDSMGLISGRSENSFVSRSRSTCYLLPSQLFQALSRTNSGFREHFQRDLGRRLDALVAVQQQREASSFLLARLGEGQLHPPVLVSPETSIVAATRLMRDRDVSAVLVDAGGRIGIFTDRDVRERSVLMGMPDSTPIGDLATYDLFTLDRDDFLFNALVLMTERAIRHVVVTRDDRIEGIFEQADLLGYLSNSSYVIASRIDRATDFATLQDAAGGVTRLIRSLFNRGVKPRYIARIVTDLNRKLFRRVFALTAAPALQDETCVMVMGSEGRGEQLLRTDQDNGLIFRTETTDDDRPARAALMQEFSAALVRLGYPPCPGNVMVSNPEWSQSLARFRADLRHWVVQPSGDAFLKLAILYDAGPAAGDSELLTELKTYLFDLVRQEDAFTGHFAKAVLSFPTPIAMFGRFDLAERPLGGKGIDIKKGGVFPIVHGVRSLALEYRVAETNTIGRIQALSGRGPFSEEFTADLIEAFDFLAMLRLREQFAALDRNQVYDNFVDVEQLRGFERNLLRDSLKIVKQFKAEVAHHFRLQLLT